MNRFPTDSTIILEPDDIKEGLNCVVCNADLFFNDIKIHFDGETESYIITLKDSCCGKNYIITFELEDILQYSKNILHFIENKK